MIINSISIWEIKAYFSLFKCFKWPNPDLFLMYFQSKTTFLQQINVQNVNPVYGTGIRSHNLLIMNLLL